MMRPWMMLLALLVLSACGGGGSSPAGSLPGGSGGSGLSPTSFVFGRLPAVASSVRRAAYLTTNVASVQIKLVSVDGAAPPSGFTLTVTSNLSLASCPCTVAGPYVPPGTDVFTLSAFDGPNGTGNVVSTASPSLTIVAGAANANTIALNGVPANVTIAPVTLAVGTPATTPLTITVTDADGNTIMGAYANPITLTDSDTSGATQLTTSGTDSPPQRELVSSSDVASLVYTGAALTSVVQIGASGAGVSSSTTTFHGSQTFASTGAPQSFTVPAGVTALTAVATGGSGSGYAAGLGGSVTATIPVTGGTQLTLLVGGQGGAAPIVSGLLAAGGAGGYNGGGAGGTAHGNANPLAPGGGGGGATSVLQGTTPLIIAGGGGGGNQCGFSGSAGGSGGYPAGQAGTGGGGNCASTNAGGGGGGTQSAPGAGGIGGTPGGSAGTAGSGGSGGAGGASTVCCGGNSYAGGGGGGGYFAGGGGGGGGSIGGGGGGGSSYYESTATAVTTVSGVQYGDGTLTLSW